MAISTDGVERRHVIRAARRWDEHPGYGGFGKSTRYDILIKGNPYPPKAIIALAIESAGGELPRPTDFRGAWDGPWHRFLTRELRFDIVPKVDAGGAAGDAAPTAVAAQLDADLQAINAEHADDRTTRDALVQARLGQGRFRRELLARWNFRCAVTGIAVPQVLRASHAKPWRHSTDAERLNPDNGLPLVATLDALFDAGLIAFKSNGQMIISPQLDDKQRMALLEGVPQTLSETPRKGLAGFLGAHRKHVFRRHGTE
ncbi:HNH endonuclease [Burkholderia seminalis]|uniref:HNH endonuclease n=1 Tax=Burkholderia seminalis TaxID=488731 RepID=UPI001CF1E8CE|nr:HNH endonuclease [Burkholderia seminalis]MCA8426885.1 HNH endonuclease [Burkholderia seminalis]